MSQNFPSPPSLNYALPPRGTDSVFGRTVAWLVIVASVAALGWSNFRAGKLAPVAATSDSPGLSMEILGRYAVGANSLVGQSGSTSMQKMAAQVEAGAKTPVDRLAAVTVLAELEGKQAAFTQLDQLKATLPADLAPQANALRKLYAGSVKDLTSADRVTLLDRLGWFGKLALTLGKPATDPDRAAIMAAGRRTMGVAFIGGFSILFAGFAGVVLLVVLLILVAVQKFSWAYHPPVIGGGVFLEAFAIYIGGMTTLAFCAPYLPAFVKSSLAGHIALMSSATILAIAWPTLRGVSRWRDGLGWHAGRGAFREIGCGLAGYIAGLPILGVGFAITLLLVKASDAHPSHPIEHMLGVSPRLTLLVFFLASIYAPITEETMFRGAFFSALRSRHGWILSAIVSSFVFAAIHPQGWTLIPMLMSIALVLAGIREWRGTILSSAAAHCLHNTGLLVIAILMMS